MSPPGENKQSATLYGICGIAGGCAASTTHVLVVPIDAAKTRIQMDPAHLRSAKEAFGLMKSEIGFIRAATVGIVPTLCGYFLQGMCKYGLYEVFKENVFQDIQSNFTRNLLSASLAESAGVILLTPFEAIRINQVREYRDSKWTLQRTTDHGNSRGLVGMYKGFFPLLLKQVPYTASKFVVYEWVRSRIDDRYTTPRCTYLGLNVPATVLAAVSGGVVSAIVSHPADTLLTKVNVSASKSVLQAMMDTVRRDMWAGLRPRILMVGGLASLQLLTYEVLKANGLRYASSLVH